MTTEHPQQEAEQLPSLPEETSEQMRTAQLLMRAKRAIARALDALSPEELERELGFSEEER